MPCGAQPGRETLGCYIPGYLPSGVILKIYKQIDNIYQKNTNTHSKNTTRIYHNRYKTYTKWYNAKRKKDIKSYPNRCNIYKIYKINTKYQAATGLGPARPWASAGPAAAWYYVFILCILDLFEYLFGINVGRFVCICICSFCLFVWLVDLFVRLFICW